MTGLMELDTMVPGREVTFRRARREDARRIAELFRLASDGVADYVWTQLAEGEPGLSPLEIGARRYAREDVAFSYQNCIVAERGARVAGNCHAFVIDTPSSTDGLDPVLRPYAELEAPGSLYISSLAVDPEAQRCGIGTGLLERAIDQAGRLGVDRLSLIVFEQNVGARRLYERFGFEEIDRRPIVPHPLIHATGNALLMVRPI
jgi:ribosomal protein S18 acetylase RimI-like enzyme